MSRGILGRLGDFSVGAILTVAGAAVVYNGGGGLLPAIGTIAGATGCAFLVLSVSE